MLTKDYKVEIENALGKFTFYYDKDFINEHQSEFEKFGTDHTTIRLWLESRGFDNLENIIMLSSNIEDTIGFGYKALQKAYESLKSIKLENLIIM
jgi:hypothetical protein